MVEIRRRIAIPFLSMMSLCLSSGCVEEQEATDKDNKETPSKTDLKLDADCPRSFMGLTLDNMTGHTYYVGSVKVEPQKNEQGWYIDYVKEDYLMAKICWEDYLMPFGDRVDSETARIPFSQFYDTTIEQMKSYPLFARKNRHGAYEFKDAFAMLDLNVTGVASISSIKVQRRDGGHLSADGHDFVTLNCNRQEHGPVELPGRFMIPIKAASYKDGLEITICDSRGGMRRIVTDMPALGAGETLSLDVAYTPVPSVFFYEGFDNCVWGADPSGRLQGYAPDDQQASDTLRRSATGYEQAFVMVPSGRPGTGLMQEDDEEYVYDMTGSYMRSRGFDDWKFMLRTKEFLGCVGVGVGFKSRGWVQTPSLSAVPAGENVKLSFRFKVDAGADENIEVMCLDGGSFTKMSLDASVESTISGASYIIDTKDLAEGWHDVWFVAGNLTPHTSFRVGGNLKKNVTHGFFIDDIYVREVTTPLHDIPGISSLDQLSVVELSFKMKFDKYAGEGLTISLPTGGFICGMSVDSRDIPDEVTGRTEWPLLTKATLDHSDYGSEEHEVVLRIESADKDMTVLFSGDDCSCSDISVKKVSSLEKKSFRLLLWNIQFGMWADQGNNYDNFVAWLKKYDADCCVFIEAETVRKTGSSVGEAASSKMLNGSSGGTYGWSRLAPRYGHSYMKVSADNTNYSQEITSKTSINVVSTLSKTYNGSGHFYINAGGRKINIVTYHGMPYNYDPDAADKTVSASNREGDTYRLDEVKYLLGQTYENSRYSSESNWIFLGDMNSHSPADNWYYGYASTGILAAQSYIIGTGLNDVIAEKYPGRFMPTTMSGKFRIDYVYASDAMMDAVKNAVVIRDKWTSEKATAVEDCTHPSDHRPILVDFEF